MIYRFDMFTLDLARRELRRGDTLVALEPQVFDVLRTLIEARERVVTRDELLDVVWHGRIVSEATISSRVNAARAAVGDTGAQQSLIRTLPRRGFRFVGTVLETAAPVTWHEAETVPASASIAGDDRHQVPALAVLPFANMSGDPGQEFFADGMAEEIITVLSRSSALRVIARSSSFVYRGAGVDLRRVGQELGASYVLEGSVRRSHAKIRINGRLIDVASGTQIWSDRFEGDLEETFALQDRVAESVAAALEPALQSAEIARLRRFPPARLDAYDMLLRAYGSIADFTDESMAAALEQLRQALELDPAYAPAMAAFAYIRAQCDFQGWGRQSQAARAGAVQLAWRAADLAATDAQILWMSAFAIWAMAETGRDSARRLFNRSLELNPNRAMALTMAGWVETMCGNQAIGRGMVLRARHLNPRDPQGWLTAGVMALAAVVDEDYAAAVIWAERALAQNRRFAVALRVLAVAHSKLGAPGRAAHAVQALLAIEPDLTVAGFLARVPLPVQRMALTYAEALAAAGLPPS